MRAFIRPLVFGFALMIAHQSLAQCTIASPGVKLNFSNANAVSGGCDINFDLYFDMQANSGGKYVYVHIWPKSLYPTLVYNNPPNLTQLTNAVATLGFYHFGGALYMLNNYAPFPTVPNFKFTGLSIVKGAGTVAGTERFTIRNITVSGIAGCSTPQELTADVWQSQSASAQNVHCFSRGLNFYANDPRITGFMICELPRQYRFQIRTIDPAGLTVNYKVYIDNGDGVYNATSDTIEIGSGSNILLNNENSFTYSSPLLGYLPYANRKPEAERAIWIVVSSPTRDNTSLARLDNNCLLLPIQLGLFTARWKEPQVLLEWNTRTEIDNLGFEVQRKSNINDQSFQPIGFVPSNAPSGNSSQEIQYWFQDPSPLPGTGLYRLKQIDHSGKFSYSPIRTVSAKQLLSQILPNPADEQATLIFSGKQRTYQVEWINALGQRLGVWIGRDQLTIPTRSFSNGIHRIKISDKQTGQSETRTLLIQHTQ
jgi:hypothetical protein